MEGDRGQAPYVPSVKGQVSGALQEDKECGELDAGPRGRAQAVPKPAATGRNGSTGGTAAKDTETKREVVAVLCVLLSFRIHRAGLSSRGHCGLSSHGP